MTLQNKKVISAQYSRKIIFQKCTYLLILRFFMETVVIITNARDRLCADVRRILTDYWKPLDGKINKRYVLYHRFTTAMTVLMLCMIGAISGVMIYFVIYSFITTHIVILTGLLFLAIIISVGICIPIIIMLQLRIEYTWIKNYVSYDITPITNISQFLDAVIDDPPRARFWYYLQSHVLRWKSCCMNENKPGYYDKITNYSRITSATRFPNLSKMNDRIENRIKSCEIYPHSDSVQNRAILKKALCDLLPVISFTSMDINISFEAMQTFLNKPTLKDDGDLTTNTK